MDDAGGAAFPRGAQFPPCGAPPPVGDARHFPVPEKAKTGSGKEMYTRSTIHPTMRVR